MSSGPIPYNLFYTIKAKFHAWTTADMHLAFTNNTWHVLTTIDVD